MRPVTVFKRVYEPPSGWKSVEHFKGKFHQWGLEVWEQDPASVAYSVAIVEKDDGQIETVPPNLVRFDDTEGGTATTPAKKSG